MRNITAEIITVGDELLYGQTLDTNSHYMSQKLDEAGFSVKYRVTVGDVAKDMNEAFAQAESRSDVTLITGGLGPTEDDLTKPLLADFFNSEMAINEEALAEVTEYFESRGRKLTELNRGQALLPVKCTKIRNRYGTAPGMLFERNGKVFVSMPGVPREMRPMVVEEVIPELKKHFELPAIAHRIIRTVGIGESFLADKIKDWAQALPKEIALAYLPEEGQVKLRMTAKGSDHGTLKNLIDEAEGKLLPMIQEYVYGYGEESLEEAIGKILIEKNKTLATAESCSGGRVASKITSIAGSSAYFQGSVVAYQNSVKEKVLGVNLDTISEHGAVSEQTVREMAEGVRGLLNADIGLASSGIAGPGGGTEEKPVGTVWIACATASGVETKLLHLGKFRQNNIELTAVHLLNLARKCLAKN
ncbi:CinA-like protein [Fulvitalea axinellae]|uniref:CinA-like protein n=1 Tax=Fulvitalea axinellae TaxID=1182444 RepID=A0AAU9C8C1_9BACT|nr:CinA-like protein [Fulvitalea axinellae]